MILPQWWVKGKKVWRKLPSNSAPQGKLRNMGKSNAGHRLNSFEDGMVHSMQLFIGLCKRDKGLHHSGQPKRLTRISHYT